MSLDLGHENKIQLSSKNSQKKHVLPFYEKLGFKKEGEEFEEAGIMHFKMYLKK